MSPSKDETGTPDKFSGMVSPCRVKEDSVIFEDENLAFDALEIYTYREPYIFEQFCKIKLLM